MIWRCGGRAFDVTRRALVMGVVNVTPDSFSDGGRYLDPAAALGHARRLVDEGADLIDVGAESTRPGAAPVVPELQIERLLPVIAPLAAERVCVSVDTASAEVARRAVEAGAEIINDVTGLGDPDMAGVIAAAGAGAVLMHMRGTPATMQQDPRYDDVVADVRVHLAARLAAARAAGIDAERIAVDPGIGFGKTLEHNVALLARLEELLPLGRPIVIGASRKSFLGRLTEADLEGRLEGGLAAAAIAVLQGARVIRTHDVGSTVKALRVAEAIAAARPV